MERTLWENRNSVVSYNVQKTCVTNITVTRQFRTKTMVLCETRSQVNRIGTRLCCRSRIVAIDNKRNGYDTPITDHEWGSVPIGAVNRGELSRYYQSGLVFFFFFKYAISDQNRRERVKTQPQFLIARTQRMLVKVICDPLGLEPPSTYVSCTCARVHRYLLIRV